MSTDSAPEIPARTDARCAKVARLIEQVGKDGPIALSLFRRVLAGKSPPSQAIKAKCLECVWFDRKAIRECTAACPLWAFRPYQPENTNPTDSQ